MASTFIHSTRPRPGGEQSGGVVESLVVPRLLTCLVLSWSESRSQLLSAVAEDESWHAMVCEDVQQFLRSVFQSEIPLTIVDLPTKGSDAYESLAGVAAQTCELSRSLMLVCGAESDAAEEQWARQLGVWAYLPGAADVNGLKMVFAEARRALARQSSVRAELSRCQ